MSTMQTGRIRDLEWHTWSWVRLPSQWCMCMCLCVCDLEWHTWFWVRLPSRYCMFVESSIGGMGALPHEECERRMTTR